MTLKEQVLMTLEKSCIGEIDKLANPAHFIEIKLVVRNTPPYQEEEEIIIRRAFTCRDFYPSSL